MPLEAPVTSALRPRRFRSMQTPPRVDHLRRRRELRDRSLQPLGDVRREGRAHEYPEPRRVVDLLQNDRHARKPGLGAAPAAERARAKVEADRLGQDRTSLGTLELE